MMRLRSTLLTAAALVLAPLAAAAQQPASAADSVRRLVAAGRPGAAIAYGRAVAQAAPDDPAAQAALAIGAMAVEDFDLAVDAADRMIALAPGVSGWQLVFGQAYLSHARANPSIGAISRVRRGRAAVERAIALDPDNLDARSTLMQFLMQAPGFAGGSREKAAEQAAEIERRDRARGLHARLDLAVADEDERAVARIVEAALPVVASRADSGSGLLGALLAAVGGLDDDDRREELTARLYASSPDDPVAAYHRARLWIIEGERLPEAERLLLGYLAGPERRGGAASRAGAHWRLAQLYERQDQDERAEEQYRKAASLDPRLRSGSRLSARMETQL